MEHPTAAGRGVPTYARVAALGFVLAVVSAMAVVAAPPAGAAGRGGAGRGVAVAPTDDPTASGSGTPSATPSATPSDGSRMGGTDPTPSPGKPAWVWWVTAAFLVVVGVGGLRVWRRSQE